MATEQTFTLKAGGNRLIPLDAGEARIILDRWDIERVANEGKTLVEVDLSCRTYRMDGASLIAQYLSPDLVKDVKIARLDDLIASVHESTALEILQTLCDCFRECNLTFVDLSDNALGNKGLTACDSVLGQQSMLEELYFSDNGIAKESMEVLARQLNGNQHLRVLHFFNNNVGEEGSIRFAEILRSCKNLEDIRYADVRAGIDGSLAIAQALDENTALVLKKLDLGCSSFEGTGLDHLNAVLGRSNELTKLNLEDCGLQPEGMHTLCNALINAEAPIEYLNLSLNIDEKFQDDEETKPLAPWCANAIGSLVYTLCYMLKVFKCETNGLALWCRAHHGAI
jgi:Ran GTPase-activating protein 1